MDLKYINIILEETIIYLFKMIPIAIPFTLIVYTIINITALYYTPNYLPNYTEFVEILILIILLNTLFYKNNLLESIKNRKNNITLIREETDNN